MSARDVVVVLEPFGTNSESVNRGLLTEGYRLATFSGGRLSAILIGGSPTSTTMLADHGVSLLYHISSASLEEYNCDRFAQAAKTALSDIPFKLLLFAHSDRSSELAPRLACLLGTAAILDCVDIRWKDGKFSYTRAVYSGQFEQESTFAFGSREIASIRPDLLDIRKNPSATQPQVITIAGPDFVESPRVRRVEMMTSDSKTVDLLYAERIIAAGYGCTDPDTLAQVHELSELLGGSVGTTRPVVDDGFLPRTRMVGQTGKTVSPDLYLALGISGSPHHLAGIQQSKKILSINSDANAPIFNFSDAGYVSDLKILLPKLIARIKRYKNEGPA